MSFQDLRHRLRTVTLREESIFTNFLNEAGTFSGQEKGIWHERSDKNRTYLFYDDYQPEYCAGYCGDGF